MAEGEELTGTRRKVLPSSGVLQFALLQVTEEQSRHQAAAQPAPVPGAGRSSLSQGDGWWWRPGCSGWCPPPRSQQQQQY